MPATFVHGVEIIEANVGPAPVQVVKSSVIGLIGSAPKWALAGAIPLWNPYRVQVVGDQVEDANGNVQQVTAVTSNAQTGTTPPSWATALNGVTVDNHVTWALVSLGGTAAFGLNVPSLVSSVRDGANYGPRIQGYSIPYALNAILQQGAAQAIVVNVFSRRKHSTDVVGVGTFNSAGALNLGHMGISNLLLMPTTSTPITGEAKTFAGTPQTIQLAHGNVEHSTMVLTNTGATTTYVEGTDYSVDYKTGLVSAISGGALTNNEAVLASYSYYSGTPYILGTDYTWDWVNGVVNLKSGGSITALSTVVASMSYADPSKVADTDIIGAFSGGAYTGIQALMTTYNSMGFFAKVLIAPTFSQNQDVASALDTMATLIRAVELIDAPPNTTVATAIANRGSAGNTYNTSSKRAFLVFPNQLFNDDGIITTGVTLNSSGGAVQAQASAVADGPYSAWVAGAIAAQDYAHGYWWSPSNRQINGMVGPDIPMYMNPFDPNDDPTSLNAAGIVTVFNSFGTGLRVWGNRSAGYPAATTPDVFISVRRTYDVMEESLQLFALQYVDGPLTPGLVDTILESGNGFIRTLIGRGALALGSQVGYDPADNPTTELANGHITFYLDSMVPSPAERITFNVYIDTNLLTGASLAPSQSGTDPGAAAAAGQ